MINRILAKVFSSKTSDRNKLRIRKSHRRLFVEHLEDRKLMAIDVTGFGAIGTSADGIVRVEHTDMDPTGTGVINPFLRIHHKDVEHGYNTDYRADGNPSQDLLDDITDKNFTNAIKLGDIRIVTIAGEQYRSFRLDLGEPGNDTSNSGLVNLSRLQFFTSTSNTEHIDQGGLSSEDYVWNNTLGGSTLRYNLDAIVDNDFTLQDLTSGNGALDYNIFVKNSVFTDVADSDYVYLYSMFGSPAPTADGTFEEWSFEKTVPSTPTAVPVLLTGQKFNDLDGDGTNDGGTDPGILNWQITVKFDSNGNGTYEIGEIHTVTTDAGGTWSFGTNILQSIANNQGAIYEVSEVQQTGWTQTFGGPVAGAYTGLLTVNNTSDENLHFGNFKNIDISGVKFYDANVDGLRDNIEPGINGWNFGLDTNGDTLPDQFAVTAGNTAATGGTFVFTNLGPGTYTVYELNGLTGTWVATTATVSAAIQASSGMNVTDLAFGNVKLGNGGGRTLGFWSNKNGKALVGADDLAMLSGLNLKGAAGDDKDFTTYANLRTWLLNGTASNMAYMLSVQLAAMSLNVHNGLVSGGSLVYAPGVTGANGAGFIRLNALMTEANTALGNDGLTRSGDANRAYQETLKNALDNANNNLNFLVGLGSWTDSNGNGVIDPGEII